MLKITREEVINQIKSLKGGTIYSVKFIKKDGSERLLNSIKGTSKGVSGEGLKFDPNTKQLLPVFDLQLRRTGIEEKKCWRMVSLDTIKEFTSNHTTYLVEG